MPKWTKNAQDKVYAGRGILQKLLLYRVWHFHFRDERGVWRCDSTQHRDNKGARQWPDKMSLKLTRVRRGHGCASPNTVPLTADLTCGSDRPNSTARLLYSTYRFSSRVRDLYCGCAAATRVLPPGIIPVHIHLDVEPNSVAGGFDAFQVPCIGQFNRLALGVWDDSEIKGDYAHADVHVAFFLEPLCVSPSIHHGIDHFPNRFLNRRR